MYGGEGGEDRRLPPYPDYSHWPGVLTIPESLANPRLPR